MRRYLGVFTGKRGCRKERCGDRAVSGTFYHAAAGRIYPAFVHAGGRLNVWAVFSNGNCVKTVRIFCFRDRFSKEFCATILKEGRKCQIRSKRRLQDGHFGNQRFEKTVWHGETAVHALAGVNLSVENGEFVAVVGTSGSGKSTLLHMLGGLDRATSGKVYVDGKDIFALKDEELTIFRRRKIGFVFQSFNLVPVLSVYENIVLPLQLDGKPWTMHLSGRSQRHSD